MIIKFQFIQMLIQSKICALTKDNIKHIRTARLEICIIGLRYRGPIYIFSYLSCHEYLKPWNNGSGKQNSVILDGCMREFNDTFA